MRFLLLLLLACGPMVETEDAGQCAAVVHPKVDAGSTVDAGAPQLRVTMLYTWTLQAGRACVKPDTCVASRDFEPVVGSALAQTYLAAGCKVEWAASGIVVDCGPICQADSLGCCAATPRGAQPWMCEWKP